MNHLNSMKFWAIVSREFNIRVRKRSFLVTTFLVPILIFVVAFVAMYVAMSSVARERVAIIDETGLYASLFKNTENYTFFSTEKSLEEFKSEGKKNSEEATAILEIRDNLLEHPEAVTLYGYNEIPVGVSRHIERKLSNFLTDKKLEATGIENIKETIESCTVDLTISSYKWNREGKKQRSSGEVASFIGFFLAMLSFGFVAGYGSLVMAGVLEEKKNRIMEVMVSSVRPIYLMAGKIVGIALVGLFQLLLWGVFFGIILLILSPIIFGQIYDLSTIANMSFGDFSGGMLGGMSSADFAEMQDFVKILQGVNILQLLLMSLLYFIGGYLLYAALYAAIAASVSSDEDANQFITPVMILQFIAFYLGFGAVENPNGSVAIWSSMIPFTSPVTMMVRIPVGVPVWQLVLSIALLYLTVFVVLWISAKIYRVGILMYGKKPSLKEMWRWFSYK